MTELKPCPFCGGEAETLTAESMHGGYLFGIMCSDCRSRGDVYNTEAEAIEAWNTRAERTCEKLPQLSDNVCIVKRGGAEMEFGYWRCSECGCENFEGAKYCMNCGAKVVSE